MFDSTDFRYILVASTDPVYSGKTGYANLRSFTVYRLKTVYKHQFNSRFLTSGIFLIKLKGLDYGLEIKSLSTVSFGENQVRKINFSGILSQILDAGMSHIGSESSCDLLKH